MILINGAKIVSQSAHFQFANEIFNNLVILMMTFVIATVLYKIFTSGGYADDTIKRMRFGALFLLMVGAIYGAGSHYGLQADVFKYTAGLSNKLIVDIDPNYSASGGIFYGTNNEFGVSGIRASDGSFDELDNGIKAQ